MMRMLKDRFTGPNSTIACLITAATAVVLFMTVAGAMVYSNTRGLVAAQGYVAHTHEVLTALEHASLLAERVDYSSRMYVLTGDQKDSSAARGGVYQFRAAAQHIGELVADNPNQKSNAQDIAGCAQGLLRSLDGLTKGGDPLTAQIQRCEQTISQMQEQEQRLLRERDQNSQHSSDTSFVTQAAYGGVALLMLLVLFGFLLRDAVMRRKINTKMTSTNLELGRSVQTLEGQAHEAETLKSCRDELQLCVDVDQVYGTAATGFSRLLEGTSGCLCVINSSRNLVEVASRWGETTLEECWAPDACCGLRSGYPRWRAPKVSEIHCAHFVDGNKPERYLCLPIVAHGNALGVVFVECENDAMMQQVKERMDGLRQFVQLTGMTLATLNLRTKLENRRSDSGLADGTVQPAGDADRAGAGAFAVEPARRYAGGDDAGCRPLQALQRCQRTCGWRCGAEGNCGYLSRAYSGGGRGLPVWRRGVHNHPAGCDASDGV